MPNFSAALVVLQKWRFTDFSEGYQLPGPTFFFSRVAMLALFDLLSQRAAYTGRGFVALSFSLRSSELQKPSALCFGFFHGPSAKLAARSGAAETLPSDGASAGSRTRPQDTPGANRFRQVSTIMTIANETARFHSENMVFGRGCVFRLPTVYVWY